MFELTAENALDYLRTQGWIGNEPAQAVTLAGGVSNLVLRVTTPERHFVLKQSRPQLRTRDAWFSDVERIYREQEVMQLLHGWLPKVVPEVLHVDRPNFVFAMSHAPVAATVWKGDLLDGLLNVNVAKNAGLVLGAMHQFSTDRRHDMERFRDHAVFVQLRVDPFYRRVQERCPDVAAAIEPLIQEMLTRKEALCHGDFTPKNILVHENAGFTLVDYETAHFGEPAMDLGLFCAHLTLKMIRTPERKQEFVKLLRAFWDGYAHMLFYESITELERRGVQHLGACLFARVDGTSPVDYLPEEPKREIVRRLGRAILLDGVVRWEQVWQWCERELAPENP
jgi:aminoglycoside phosphotransferase (APT) family kinase protein